MRNQKASPFPLQLLICAAVLFSAFWLASCGPLPTVAGTSPVQQATAGELEVAHLMATLSKISYLIDQDEETLAAELSANGFAPPEYFRNDLTGTAAFIARGQDTVVVVFRGTAGLRNLFFVDLNFSQVPGLAGNVHRGFQTAFEALRDPIHAQIVAELAAARQASAAAAGNPPKLILAGHSLGSALAQLAALYEVQQGNPVFGVYTFGSPRVGDGCFASGYNQLLGDVTFHHKIAGDRVSEVPFVWQGYAHTGRTWRLIDPGGGQMASSQPGPELACGEVIKGQERSPEDDAILNQAQEEIDQSLGESGGGGRGAIGGNHAIALYESLIAQLLAGVGLRYTPAP